MTDALAFMRSIDAEYRRASGLTERKYYSIFYSKIQPSDIMILGYNPGGSPESWDESLLASRSFYENNEHEYVDCNYPLATAMRTFLRDVLKTDDLNRIRSIPKSNLIFRRSSGQDSLSVPPRDALLEAKPFVEKMIVRAQPRVIVLEGTVTLDSFEKLYCQSTIRNTDGPAITTPNGRNCASIYRLDRGIVRCLGKECLLVGLGHPSKYAGRVEWQQVIARASGAIVGWLR